MSRRADPTKPRPYTTLRWACAEMAPFGWALLAASPQGVAWLQFGEDPAALEAALREDFRGQVASIQRDEDGLAAWMGAVRALLAGSPAAAEALPLDPGGTEFQRQVWDALCAIPRGETLTYTQLAERVGRPRAIRAAGGACARNRIALLIPCHRAVAADGGLAGFRWGTQRKRMLLEMERQTT